jgi:cell wall-associated NlpC family hydrolase
MTPIRPLRWIIAAVSLAALLAACGTRPVAVTPSTTVIPARSDAGAERSDVTLYALGLVGTPYRYGGNTPDRAASTAAA